MSVTVIVGSQWGDEGKGKITDLLSEKIDIVARYQGGPNAGHTVVFDGQEIILHQIPSGILRPQTTCVLGTGMVINPEVLVNEREGIKNKGINVEGRLLISNRAHVITEYHKALDQAKENAATGRKKIGTTGRGMGPAYVDMYNRTGITFADLINPTILRDKVQSNVEYANGMLLHIYKVNKSQLIDPNELLGKLLACGQTLKPYITETSKYLHDAIRLGKNTLLEGAQGAMLDINFGTYPFVTSSHPIAGGACTGLGIGPKTIDFVLGVVKAYTTRVGEGPFPTEFIGSFAEEIRELGGEFGATTGRPRRCGWLDTVLVNYSVRLNGLTHLAITKLDVLDTLKEIKICTGYKYHGETIDYFPADTDTLNDIEPVYETWPGWQTPTKDCRIWDDLPINARDYLNRIMELTDVTISIVSVGPDRNQTIMIDFYQT